MSTTDPISVSEASRMLRGEKHFVIALVLRGELRSVGNGPEIRVSRAAVEAYRRKHPALPAESVRDEDESVVHH
jgi:excisionase family DNA binding protein